MFRVGRLNQGPRITKLNHEDVAEAGAGIVDSHIKGFLE